MTTSTAITACVPAALLEQIVNIASIRATRVHASMMDAARRHLGRPSTVSVSRDSPDLAVRASWTGVPRMASVHVGMEARASNEATNISVSVHMDGMDSTVTCPASLVPPLPLAEVLPRRCTRYGKKGKDQGLSYLMRNVDRVLISIT